jgi:hypothetical protein
MTIRDPAGPVKGGDEREPGPGGLRGRRDLSIPMIAAGEGHGHQRILILLSVIADFRVRAGLQGYRRLSYRLTLGHVLMPERQPRM